MSTVKVVNVQHPSASTAAVTLAADGSMTGSFPAPNRNLLYNGAMQVAQRGTSTASITTSGYYTADRWKTALADLGTWTQSVEADGPTGSGLTKSMKILCTAADTSPTAGDVLIVQQILEGQDLQRIAKGTASAQQLTLSFWVKSNKTGTYIAELEDSDNTRQVSASYTVSASATWERKTITFPADATGAFANDNGASVAVNFWLSSGSTYTSGTLNTSWASTTSANRAPGQTNLAAATNNYWQVTGVQLEVGPTATGFEFKSYGQELRECQRYYFQYKSAGDATTAVPHTVAGSSATFYIGFPVSMRTAPNLSATSGSASYFAEPGTVNISTIGISRAATKTGTLLASSGATVSSAGYVTLEQNSSVAFNAEL